MTNTTSKFSFNVGDRVWVSKIKGVFEKGYEQTFTDEIFIVKEQTSALRPYYKLQDYAGKDIKGSFYAEELQRINPAVENVYCIQKILAARGRGKNKQLLVKWRGWSDKFKGWVKASEVRDI